MKKNKLEFLKKYVELCKEYGYYIGGNYRDEEDYIYEGNTNDIDYQEKELKEQIENEKS